YQPLNEIYQNLNQHKDWERQLKTKLRDKEFKLSQCSDWQLQQKLQHEVLVLEGRVSRCQQALTKIEQTIMKRERKG
ncbi:primosomal replication protein PriC, partial [Photobacterium damselae]